MINQELVHDMHIESGGMLASAILHPAEQSQVIVPVIIFSDVLDKHGFHSPREVWATYIATRNEIWSEVFRKGILIR